MEYKSNASSGEREYPYSFHIALDGNGLNGLEGRAGVCLFRYDPVTNDYDYKIKYFDGLAGGHAVSVNNNNKIGYLGSTAQQLLFYDTDTLEEVDRVSTLRFESTDSSIKGSTHAAWLNNSEAIVSMGDGFWQTDLTNLTKPKRLIDHEIKCPHALKLTSSGRYLVYGGMDHPTSGEAREVGIFDMQTSKVRRVELPATCWHLVCHPNKDVFYALSFRVSPQNGYDYHEWGISQFKEYVFEIDAETGTVLRHWSAGQDTPAHINSDVCISDKELIFCNGASATIVMIDLETFTSYRMIDERPGFIDQLRCTRQSFRTAIDTMARGSIFTNGNYHLRAFRTARGTLLDSVYGCQLSADQSLLFTANRGLNCITIYNYPDNDVRIRVKMPELREVDESVGGWITDPRLGFHHACLVNPTSGSTPIKISS